VLGWQDWRELEARYGLGVIRDLLTQAIAEGSLPAQPVDALAHVLLAAVDEAALYIANADDPLAARDEALGAVERLMSGLGIAPPVTAIKRSSRPVKKGTRA
jgi:hypothetical protein